MYLQRKWYMNGEVEENEEDLILPLNRWECNGFHIMGISETHAVPFFDTYLGRNERDSAPLGSISTSIPPQLIVAPTPMPEHFWKIHKATTKWFISQRQTRLVNTSIAPVVLQEQNIQSCIMCPIPAWSPSSAKLTLTASFWANVKSWFLGGWLRFATDVHPNSMNRPHHRSIVTSERPFKPSIVAYLPLTRRRRHISLQL